MKLTFLGAAGTVTGSKYLLEADGGRILVDCGLYQGVKQLRLRNWARLPVEPASIDAVLLTHAHIDHSGYVPALVRDSFRGPVRCSAATLELGRILLPDAGHLQEEDASYANRKGFSKHHAALPLYTEADSVAAIDSLVPVGFDRWEELGPFRFRLRPAGQILGAASIEVEHGGRRVLFSGDLGRSEDLLMHPPSPPGDPDWIVVESTYGDRLHPAVDPQELAPDARNTVLFPGFQAPGTRGDAMVRGVQQLKLHGAWVPVEAEVVSLDIFSAHADQAELLGWLRACGRAPRQVFVTHGESVPADALRRLAQDQLGYAARVPEYGETVELV